MKRFTILLSLFLTIPAFAECFFREDTASQTFLVGPFLDGTDGITAETAITPINTDIRISKNGGNTIAKNSGGCTHDEAGMFLCTFDATDTNTAGMLQIYTDNSIDATSIVPVWHECTVYAGAYFDLLDGTTAIMTSRQAGNILETTITTATTQLELDLAAGESNNDAYNSMCAVFTAGTEGCSARVDDYTGAGAILFLDATANTCGGVTLDTADTIRIQDGVCGVALEIAQLDLDVITGSAGAVLDADAITAAKIATDAIGALEIAADAIGASEIATDAIGSEELGTNAIGSTQLGANAIGATQIGADAITAAKIATDAIGALEIAANAIGAAEIDTDAIGAAEIAANAIGSSELATDAIGASEFSQAAADKVWLSIIETAGLTYTGQCIMAALLSYAGGEVTTAAGISTYKDPSGTSNRIVGTVTGATRDTITITCP